MMDYGTAGDDAKDKRAGTVKREPEGEVGGSPVRRNRRKESEKREEVQDGEARVQPKVSPTAPLEAPEGAY